MEEFSGAVIRAHGLLSLRAWDHVTTALAFAFVFLGLILIAGGDETGGQVSIVGGLVIFGFGEHARRTHRDQVWALASASTDPIETLALYEYLYRVCFRDLLVLSQWRKHREESGLPVLCEPSEEAPPQVHSLMAHLRARPCEA